MTLLGSLLCFPNVYPNMPLHQPGHQTNEYQHKSTGKDIKVCISALQAVFVKYFAFREQKTLSFKN